MVASAVGFARRVSKPKLLIGLGILAAAALLITGQNYLWGTHHPHLGPYRDHERLLPTPHAFQQIEWVHNSGSAGQYIAAVDSSERGVVMTSSNAVGRTLQPDRTARLVFSYRVTDCRLILAAPGPRNTPPPVHLILKRWWGHQTTSVTDHGSDYNGGDFDACGGHPG